MAQNDDLSSLERVRERLYSTKGTTGFEQPHLREQTVQPASGWRPDLDAPAEEKPSRISGSARFFIIALAFFLITAGGAVAYLVFGGRSVSTNNIIVSVQGPTTISSGDTVPLLITIQNKNPVAIHGATLSVDFPEGTKDPADPTVPLAHASLSLGDIQPGGTSVQTVKATLFGSEGQTVELPLKVEYTSDGSISTFIKNAKYDLTVTTSPLSLTVQALSQVSSGQKVTVDVVVRSNATVPLQAVAVQATYPSSGFISSGATPSPSVGNLFSLGTLGPGEEKRITITGTLLGESNDQRTFAFTAGTLSTPDAPSIASPYATQQATIQLTQPFLATTLTVNHDSTDNPVVRAGSKQQALLAWTNTLPVTIKNGQISVALSGSALDPASVMVTNGFYRSSDQTVLFGPDSSNGLASLEPGDTGQGTISFSTKTGSALSALRQPTITFTVSVSGQRIGESNVPETISSTVTRVAKVGTDLGLATKIVHTTGPIANSGAFPPVHDAETTYTVQYALTNTVNAVAGAKVVTTLPSYVRYTGKVSPADGSITYNESTRTVTWAPGDIAAGTLTPKTAAFQIAFTPSVSQVHTSPILLYAQQVTGTDRFTQGQISGSVEQLNTQISSDPAYAIIDGQVQ